MKVKLYFGALDKISHSGIGRAFVHQKRALDLAGVDYITHEDQDMDYDILHINTVLPDSFPEIIHAKMNGKKVIYHAHSTEEDFRNSFLFSNALSGIFKRWLVFLYSKADYILTPTPYSKSLLTSYQLEKPIKAISNGIDLEEYTPTKIQIEQFNQKYQINQDDIVIISVGWLFERKGFDTFIEVAKLLPNYKFFWFGDVEKSRPTFKIQMLINHLPPNVILPGYVDGNIIKGAYGRSNIFFFPSREETEGIVVLEALASKCDVLLRDIPVFDPWLENGRDCYKASDEQGFVEMIQKMIHEEVPSLIENGYQVAKERQLDIIGQELLDVYTEVLEMETE